MSSLYTTNVFFFYNSPKKCFIPLIPQVFLEMKNVHFIYLIISLQKSSYISYFLRTSVQIIVSVAAIETIPYILLKIKSPLMINQISVLCCNHSVSLSSAVGCLPSTHIMTVALVQRMLLFGLFIKTFPTIKKEIQT